MLTDKSAALKTAQVLLFFINVLCCGLFFMQIRTLKKIKDSGFRYGFTFIAVATSLLL
jgi:hypothetical protein